MKESKDKFTKVFLIALMVMLLASGFLAILNTKIQFKLKGIVNDKNNVELVNSSIKLKFDSPIDFGQNAKNPDEVPNLKNFINIEPTVDFLPNVSGSTLTLNFKETLQSDSIYKIIISKDLKDVYGKNLGVDKIVEFKTRKNIFGYIERNYPNSNDLLIENSISLDQKKVIYQDKLIDKFAFNKNYYVAIIENEDLSNNIKVISRKDNSKVIDLNLKNQKVKNVELLNNQDKLIFVAYNIKINRGYPSPDGFSKIYIYDVNTLETTIYDLSEKQIEPGEIILAHDDKTLLFKNQYDSIYYLFDINNIDNIVAIGRQLQSGGFDKTGTRIIFTNFDPTAPINQYPFISIYSADRKTSELSATQNFTIDPKFFNLNEDIIFSEKYSELEGSKGIFKLVKFDGENYFDILQFENESVEFPKLSPDDRYVLAEVYNEKILLDFSKQRQYEFQAKPFRASLVIYDLKENKIVEKIDNGLEAKWE